MLKKIKTLLQDYFLTGILVLGPLAICILVVKAVVEGADAVLLTSRWLPAQIPGLGFVLSLGLILFAGFLGRNILGRFIFGMASDILAKIPFLGTVYVSIKQVLETLFVDHQKHFSRVVMVEFPQPGHWSLAFVTSETAPEEVRKNLKEQMICIFLPTTPIPTNGFYFFVEPSKTRETDISVQQAFKIIVSLGLARES